MTIVVSTVIFVALLYKLLSNFYFKKSDSNDLAIWFVILSMFFLSTLYSNILLFVTLLPIISKIKSIKLNIPVILYIVFLTYCVINVLCLSRNAFYGIMMILKLLIPFVLLLFGYNTINKSTDYDSILKRIIAFIPVFSILCSFPISARQKYLTPIFKSWSAGDAELFAVLIAVPFTIYILYREKKYLKKALWFFLTPLTMIRRTVLGGQFIVVALFAIYKKGIKAIIIIGIFFILSIVMILNVPQLKNRFFGGDKGSIENVSNIELISSTKYISTSGRSFMWDYMTEKFYTGHEIFGCGLGTMKSYLRENSGGETESFEMLHNDQLHLKIELGLFGMALFYLFVLSLVFKTTMILIRNKEHDKLLVASAFCCLSMLVCVFFCMFFSNMLSQINEISVAFMFIGFFLKIADNKFTMVNKNII